MKTLEQYMSGITGSLDIDGIRALVATILADAEDAIDRAYDDGHQDGYDEGVNEEPPSAA